jgi:hypothetical protein
MYLRTKKNKYYQIVESIRNGEQVYQRVIKHIGVLNNDEANQLRLILKLTQNPSLLKKASRAITKKETSIKKRPPLITKYELDKDWLKEIYFVQKKSLNQIAKLCGVNRSVIRRNLIECGAISASDLKKLPKKQISVEFGWDIVDGEKTTNPKEQKVIKQVFTWRDKNGLSYYKVALKLNSKGITGKRGGPWDQGSVRRLVLRNQD